jgi:hypothetical protein
MEEALRIEEYTKHKNITHLPENIQNIINSKKAEERVRRNRVKFYLDDALKNATFFINGNKVDIKGGVVKEKISIGLKQLVDTVYTKLSYIKKFYEDPKELLQILGGDQQTIMAGVPQQNNDLAIAEVMNFIGIQEDIGKQVRVKLLIDRFLDKPYGWRELDISALIATLFRDQKIKLRYNGESLETGSPTVITVLTKLSEQDKVIVNKRTKVDETLIKAAKNICKELWNKVDIANDEDGLAKDLKSLIAEQLKEIKSYINWYEGRRKRA